MNFSLPPGTLTLLPVAQLDKIRRYPECIANFACEIRGRDVLRCIQAISPMTHELENMKDGSYRVHKPTEPQARLIQQQVQNWVASSPESREVQAYPVSTDHSCQQAKDVSNVALSGTHAAAFNGGIALTGGPWGVSVETNKDGTISAVHLHGPGYKKASTVPAEALKSLVSAPKAEAKTKDVQELKTESKPELESTEKAPTKPKPEIKKPSKAKFGASSRKRPSKTNK